MIKPSERNKSEASIDANLFKKISSKDPDALSSLYDRHSKYLFTIIYYIVKDRSEAEDVLQEVYLQIWEKIEFYDDSLGSPLAWMTRLTRNKCIDRLRSKSFRSRSEEMDIEKFFDLSEEKSSSNPEKVTDAVRDRNEIVKALKSLAENQRELIEYAYFKGYTQSELAEHFKIPLGTVKTRMRSAMMQLRTKLKRLIE